ncbi:MAG: hypothetical protein ABIV13_07015, partial [Fimbriimonadales bacterium]
KWEGTTTDSFLPTSINLEVRREGALFVIDVLRKELLGEMRERVYVDGETLMLRQTLRATFEGTTLL